VKKSGIFVLGIVLIFGAALAEAQEVIKIGPSIP